MVNKKNILLSLIIACTTSCAMAMEYEGPTEAELLAEKKAVIARQWNLLNHARATRNRAELQLLARMNGNIKIKRAAMRALREITRRQPSKQVQRNLTNL